MKEVKISWLILCGFVGIILGTIFANTMAHLGPSSLEVFALDQYSVYSWVLEERKALTFYLFRQRGLQFLGLLILGFLCNSVFLAFVLTFFGGFVWGLILSLESMRLGIQGLFLSVACFLPQGLCYVLAVFLFLFGKEAGNRENRKMVVLFRCFILPLVITVAGILLEIWISPELIQWIVQ